MTHPVGWLDDWNAPGSESAEAAPTLRLSAPLTRRPCRADPANLRTAGHFYVPAPQPRFTESTLHLYLNLDVGDVALTGGREVVVHQSAYETVHAETVMLHGCFDAAPRSIELLKPDTERRMPTDFGRALDAVSRLLHAKGYTPPSPALLGAIAADDEIMVGLASARRLANPLTPPGPG